MKVLIKSVKKNLFPYLETLYDYNFEETKLFRDFISEGYITFKDLNSLSNFVFDMNKHFNGINSSFILTSVNNEIIIYVYDGFIE